MLLNSVHFCQPLLDPGVIEVSQTSSEFSGSSREGEEARPSCVLTQTTIPLGEQGSQNQPRSHTPTSPPKLTCHQGEGKQGDSGLWWALAMFPWSDITQHCSEIVGKAPPPSPVPASKDRCVQARVYVLVRMCNIYTPNICMCMCICKCVHLKACIPVSASGKCL